MTGGNRREPKPAQFALSENRETSFLELSKPVEGSLDWGHRLNENFEEIERRVALLASELNVSDVGGYEPPAIGQEGWAEPLNEVFAAIENDVKTLAHEVGVENVGNYQQPRENSSDWHISLNYNFFRIEEDIEAIAAAVPGTPQQNGKEDDYVIESNYEINLGNLRDAIDAIDEAETTQEKGDTFEDLADLLFSAIPFLRIRGRQKLTKTSEIDLVVEYIGHDGKTFFDNWSDFILVECKNWSGSVGAPQIKKFSSNMSDLKMDLGVIFARNGVSGDTNSDAQCAIRDIYKQHDRMILAVEDDEIAKLLEGKSFYEILEEQAYRRRMDIK